MLRCIGGRPASQHAADRSDEFEIIVATDLDP